MSNDAGGVSRPRVKDHRLTVVGVEDFTHWYRRVRFDSHGLFTKMDLLPGGYLLLNLGLGDRVVQRSYTIAGVEAEQLWIDFVDHEPPGPGCAWARAARPGLELSVSQPSYVWRAPLVDDAVMVADPTATPALNSLLGGLASSTRAKIVIVDGHCDREAIPHPSDVEVEWVERLDEDCLARATHTMSPDDCYAWVAGSRTMVKTARDFFRTIFTLPRSAQHCQTYWIAQS